MNGTLWPAPVCQNCPSGPLCAQPGVAGGLFVSSRGAAPQISIEVPGSQVRCNPFSWRSVGASPVKEEIVSDLNSFRIHHFGHQEQLESTIGLGFTTQQSLNIDPLKSSNNSRKDRFRFPRQSHGNTYPRSTICEIHIWNPVLQFWSCLSRHFWMKGNSLGSATFEYKTVASRRFSLCQWNGLKPYHHESSN